MRYLIFFIVVGIIAFSCKKEEVISNQPNIYYGNCSTKKNGTNWEAKPYGVYDTIRWKREAIGIFARYFENNIWKETIGFSEIPLKKGVFSLKRANFAEKQNNVGAVFYLEEENGHVAGHEFLLDTIAKSNRFEVVNYDTKSGEIEVKFSATFFIKDRSKASIIDTIKFTNGEILTKAYN